MEIFIHWKLRHLGAQNCCHRIISLVSLIPLVPLIPLVSLIPLVPLLPSYLLYPSYPLYLSYPLILICILKDDWMHPVTPFQNLNFHQSGLLKIGLLIINVLKAPLHPVPKSLVPPNSMNNWTQWASNKFAMKAIQRVFVRQKCLAHYEDVCIPCVLSHWVTSLNLFNCSAWFVSTEM